ncbi:hypothetical protein ANPL_02835 [Anaplasma platys]|uniref:Uncharacterized protein n=1 Tax=Anaplasma platys TaxID=949 RepID=A0A858PYK0_9RICK|nr:hypothetical protein [Anaplasma platys]QJC27628.1 hypothetical protein ANPL_02835 [Anaplasma platys]
MKKIIEGVAREAASTLGSGLDLSAAAVNEVVIRSVIYVLFKGKSPKYCLVNTDGDPGLQACKYDILIPGTAISVQQMRKNVTPTALGRVASVEGRSVLARYLFSISAFMPDHLVWLFSVSEISDLRVALKEVCEILRVVSETAKNRNCAINWPKVYSVCSVRILNVLNTASDQDILKVAHAVYTGPACDEISKVRDELLNRLRSGESWAGHVMDLVQDLRLLSNFNPALARHYRLKKKVDAGKNQNGETLIIKPAAVIQSLMRENGEWEHEVSDRVGRYIRKHAYVNAEMILTVCLLLNQPIELTVENIGALQWPNGKVAYSFSPELTFPNISESACSHGKLKGDVLTTKEGMELVGLLLFLHHKMHRYSFAICYSKLAEEIKRIAKGMKESSQISDNIARLVHDAFFPSNESINSAIMDYGRDIASYFAKRIVFLQEFVMSEDYPLLVEFIKQSNHQDKSSDFKRYLEEKRKADSAAAQIIAAKASRRRALKFARGFGETIGLLSSVTGMMVMAYVAYVRFYNEKAKSLLSAISLGGAGLADVLIAGIALFSFGITLTVFSWISVKGAASAVKSIKNATFGSLEDKFMLPCDNAEYSLSVQEVPSGPVLIGYIGNSELQHGRERTGQATDNANCDIAKISDTKTLLHQSNPEKDEPKHSEKFKKERAKGVGSAVSCIFKNKMSQKKTAHSLHATQKGAAALNI